MSYFHKAKMLNILNLEEDKKRICEIVDDYSEKHATSEWKYENALKTLIDKQLVTEHTITTWKIRRNVFKRLP